MPNQDPGFGRARGDSEVAGDDAETQESMHARAGAGVFLIPGVVRLGCVCVVVRGGSDRDPLCREGHLEMSFAVRDWRLAHGVILLAARHESALGKLEPRFQMRGLCRWEK